MSSAPLLGHAGLPVPVIMQDHVRGLILICKTQEIQQSANMMTIKPIFLRASHSPWRWIPQNVLVVLRGGVLAYLVATSIMTGHYKVNVEESADGALRNVFDFALITSAMTFMYHLVTFVSCTPCPTCC